MANVNDNMIVNYQSAQLMASIVSQATGVSQAVPITASEFVSVAQLGLKAGYDTLATAISQVLSATIFSIRPYSAKFKGLRVDQRRWGNHVRKVNAVDKPFLNANRFALQNGQHNPDMFDVRKNEVVQTNFYSSVAYDDYETIYRDQLNTAFSGEAEFDNYIAMIMQNLSDRMEQGRENLSRGVIANLIAGVSAQAAAGIAPERVIHLVTEYNNEMGTSVTAADVMQPANFPSFARWMFGYIKTISDRLTNRSAMYHQNFTIDNVVKNLMRHTPIERQKCYMYSPLFNNISANVLSTVFYQKNLKLMDYEDVDFWQSAQDPMRIDYTASYTNAAGTVITSSVDLSKVVGVIFDEEAAGWTQKNEWSATSPFEAAGGYTNYWVHMWMHYWNDFTENVIVLLLDEAPSTAGTSNAAANTRTSENEPVTDETKEAAEAAKAKKNAKTSK